MKRTYTVVLTIGMVKGLDIEAAYGHLCKKIPRLFEQTPEFGGCR